MQTQSALTSFDVDRPKKLWLSFPQVASEWWRQKRALRPDRLRVDAVILVWSRNSYRSLHITSCLLMQKIYCITWSHSLTRCTSSNISLNTEALSFATQPVTTTYIQVLSLCNSVTSVRVKRHERFRPDFMMLVRLMGLAMHYKIIFSSHRKLQLCARLLNIHQHVLTHSISQ